MSDAEAQKISELEVDQEPEGEKTPESETEENDEPDAELDLEGVEGEEAQVDEIDSEAKGSSVQAAPRSVPEGIDWTSAGPRLWHALHGILSGNKTKDEDKYTIEASHEAVGEAHDALKQ